MRIRFERVIVSRSRRGKCSECGKAMTQRKTFMQTINPFNKDADGLVKTRSVIVGELHMQAAQWAAEKKMTHDKCARP